MTRLVGLTGGISCGKSLVAAECVQHSLPVIDCDAIARQCTKKGSWGWRRVRAAFKEYEVFELDGAINRQKLGDIIFTDVCLRRRLNQATHLPIQLRIVCNILHYMIRLTPTVVIDMPLLFETKSGWLFSDIIVVTCDHEQQLQRLCHRDDISEEVALTRIRAQIPQAYKAAHASILIDNSGTITATRQQVTAVQSLKLLSSIMQVETAVDNLIRKHSVLETILLPFGLGAAFALVAYMIHGWLQ